jgi:endonuclease-8
VLFVLGVTPWTPVGSLVDPRVVVERVRDMIALSARSALQTTTGDSRPGRRQYVHARAGRPCRRCGTTVRVAPLGAAPQERVAFYCPRCQRGPLPGGRTR